MVTVPTVGIVWLMERRTVWVLVAKVEFSLPQGTGAVATVQMMEE